MKPNNKEIIKETKKLVDNSESFMVISEKGVYVYGMTPNLLALYGTLTKELLNCKDNTKELLEHAFKMAFMNSEELYQELLKTLDKAAKKATKSTETKKETKKETK